MLVALLYSYLACLGVLPAVFTYIEYRQWWTLRLGLSCLIPWRLLTATMVGSILTILYYSARDIDLTNPFVQALLATTSATFAIGILQILLPLAESRQYVHARWSAWTGHSRTGIPFHLSRYLGDRGDWSSLSQSRAGRLQVHPVEKFAAVVSPFSGSIVEDPTTLLTARLTTDEEADTVWVSRSEAKAGVFAPSSEADRSVSLLWGQSLGFTTRCSRGIISIPTRYLGFKPTLANGLDARPICLAHGILARNKGLQPQSLICNLSVRQSFRDFEENSIYWPRPAKTLRSFYREEFARSFSGLGEGYITAATELALLIADVDFSTLQDWLSAGMEHQDLDFNNRAAELGATMQDLDLLYRGHYASMLASLSLHKAGNRLRPELLVFERVLKSQELDDNLPWLAADDMRERMAEERALVGLRGIRLIGALV